MTLGENGHYFIRDEWGAAWNLPDSISEHVNIDNDDDPVDRLFLGKDDAYLAQTRSGALRWNFRGNYGGLVKEIKYSTAGVRCLGMNLLDDRSYFLLFKDGRVACNPGRGRGLTKKRFETWSARFLER